MIYQVCFSFVTELSSRIAGRRILVEKSALFLLTSQKRTDMKHSL